MTDQEQAIYDDLQQEIDGLLQEQRTHDEAGAAQQVQWNKIQVQLGKPRIQDAKRVELEDKAHKLHSSIMRHIFAGIRISERLQVLRNPTEQLRRLSDVERKAQVAERLKSVKEEAKKRQEEREAKPFVHKASQTKRTAREDGVPAAYLKENGAFITGYDSKLKSHLVAAALGKNHPESLHRFTKEKALQLLEARGWMKYLDTAKRRQAEEKGRAQRRTAKTASKA